MRNPCIEKSIDSNLSSKTFNVSYDWSETETGIDYIDIHTILHLFIIEVIPVFGIILWIFNKKLEDYTDMQMFPTVEEACEIIKQITRRSMH